MLRHTDVRKLLAGTCFLFLSVSIESCRGESKLDTREAAAHAQELLEPPFHFLLRIADYVPARLSQGSDMFSACGELALTQKSGSEPASGIIRERILRAAKRAGWKQVEDLPDVESPDPARYEVIHSREDLAISKAFSSPGQNPPTRYSCRIWISENRRFIVVAYRVDGE